MRKTLHLAIKDLLLTFRDLASVLIMFALPLALTLISHAAFGGNDSPAIEAVPLVIYNQDKGALGEELVAVYQSGDLSDMLSPELVDSEAKARRAVEEDKAAAAVLIPGDFTSSLYSRGFDSEPSTLRVLTNPTQTISAVVVQSVAGRFIEIVNTTTVGIETSFAQLLKTGRISTDDISAMAPTMGEEFGTELTENSPVSIEIIEPQPIEEKAFSFSSVNYLEYYAASMAVLGLMFTITGSTRTILAERENGTLARFHTTPSSNAQLIGGKVLSTIITGCLQMAVLVAVTTLLLNANWGAPGPLAVFTLMLVAAVSAMGMLIAAFARSHAQAGMMGSAVTLVLSAASGNFLPRGAFPQWLQNISLIGPSAWGIEGYQALASGAALENLIIPILALAAMTAAFFLLSLVGLRRHLA